MKSAIIIVIGFLVLALLASRDRDRQSAMAPELTSSLVSRD